MRDGLVEVDQHAGGQVYACRPSVLVHSRRLEVHDIL